MKITVEYMDKVQRVHENVAEWKRDGNCLLLYKTPYYGKTELGQVIPLDNVREVNFS